jgi:hypothetical protein
MSPILIQAYYFGFLFWFGLSAGCFALLLVHHAIRGAWALPIQRVLEAGTKCFVVMMPLFFVLLAGMNHLYAWANPIPAGDLVLRHKAAYLNTGGFLIRTLVTFAIWGWFAWKLLASTKRQEKSLDSREADYRASWAAPGIVLFMLTATMTYTDLVMSRDAHWYSTIYPALIVVGQALGAIAFAILFVTNRSKQEPYTAVVTPKLIRDMGNLTLALTMLWAYFTFSQYVIIWSGNLPEETAYFHKRLEASWNILGGVVLVAQFFGPFMLLLSGRTKRTVGIIRQVAGLSFFAHFLDTYWNVAPFSIPDTSAVTGVPALDPKVLLWFLGAFLIVGAVWYAAFEYFRKQSSELPTYDPRLQLASEGSGH